MLRCVNHKRIDSQRNDEKLHVSIVQTKCYLQSNHTDAIQFQFVIKSTRPTEVPEKKQKTFLKQKETRIVGNCATGWPLFSQKYIDFK